MKRGAFAQSRALSGGPGGAGAPLRPTASYREPGSRQFRDGTARHLARHSESSGSDSSDSDLDYVIDSSPDVPAPRRPAPASTAAPGDHEAMRRAGYHVQHLRNPDSARPGATDGGGLPYEPSGGKLLDEMPDEPEDMVGLTAPRRVGCAVGCVRWDLAVIALAV